MKTFKGIVTSLAREKTATVELVRKWKHPLYKKYINRSKRHACHVDDIDLAVGDKVLIQECRPISKTKHFKVIENLSQS